jgi:hypothetical protein
VKGGREGPCIRSGFLHTACAFLGVVIGIKNGFSGCLCHICLLFSSVMPFN